MILLDTNVISEFMRPGPEPAVVAWLDAQRWSALWTCVVTRAEIELGLALMPAGKRQMALAASAKSLFSEDLAGRCLPFDERVVEAYVQILADRTRAGRPISIEDAQIAAIALSHGLTLATRNTRDFDAIEGLSLINPWQLPV